MKTFRADLHIHTVLSPCGDLEMSPRNIVAKASASGLDIIGLTDHNTTRHCRLVSSLAEKAGIFVMTGAEVTTAEEVHCLVFFENLEKLKMLQDLIDSSLPDIKNNPALFGYQVEVDEDEKIIYTEEKMLLNATGITIDRLEKFVHQHNGIFIPAHADRMKNSIFSQLGFIPGTLNADAIEISSLTSTEEFIRHHPEASGITIIRSSDAHYVEQIGISTTDFLLGKPSFGEILMALHEEKGRRVEI
ncbi:MAG TPA: PHP domain-containing protein [Bacteroidales bacterium]|nr:PHP domain-containing protein [Bacteroidales bacterium]